MVKGSTGPVLKPWGVELPEDVSDWSPRQTRAGTVDPRREERAKSKPTASVKK